MSEIDVFVSSTGNFNISALNHFKKLKNNEFVGNTGHFDDEINLAGSGGLEGMKNRRLHASEDPTERCLPLAGELKEALNVPTQEQAGFSW